MIRTKNTALPQFSVTTIVSVQRLARQQMDIGIVNETDAVTAVVCKKYECGDGTNRDSELLFFGEPLGLWPPLPAATRSYSSSLNLTISSKEAALVTGVLDKVRERLGIGEEEHAAKSLLSMHRIGTMGMNGLTSS